MRSLVKFFNIKRLVASVLLLCTLITTFASFNTIEVSADSNSRRAAMIELASGTPLLDIDAENNIDMESLRTIALYLSNFYIPFSTILDDNYEGEEGKESEFRAEMFNALTHNCGFDATTADFLINVTLESSLSTCSKLYVRKSDLALIWSDNFGFSGTNESVRDGVFYKSVRSSDNTSSVKYNSLDAYCEEMGIQTGTDSATYVAVTYPVFLEIMAHSLSVSREGYFTGTTSESYSIEDRDKVCIHPDCIKDYLESTGLDNLYVDDSGNVIQKIYDDAGNETGSECHVYYSDSYSYLGGEPRYWVKCSEGKYDNIPIINFYYLDSGKNPFVVFSNSEECMQSYALVNDRLRYDLGYGSGFSVLTPNDIVEVGGNKLALNGTVLLAPMYVNWVGDLVLDNGVYRTIVLPGCANPHMLAPIESNGLRVPMQNVYAISAINEGHIHQLKSSADTYLQKSWKVTTLEPNYYLDVFVGDDSLFRRHKWTQVIGSSQTNFEGGFLGFGEDWDNLVSMAKGNNNVTISNEWGSDNVLFPAWDNIGCSTLGGAYTITPEDYPTYSGDYAPLDITMHRWSVSENIETGSEQSENKSYGLTKWNTDLIWYGSLAEFSETSSLSTFFKSQNTYDLAKAMSENIETTAMFKDITEQGTTAVYNDDTTRSLFQTLFVTYCFACFNSDDSSFNEAENLLNLKMDTKNFPKAKTNIDWASLYSTNIEDQVLSFIYYLLHPTEGIDYIATWFKNKVSGIILNTHEDIVGGSDSNSSTGMTKYLGFTGYTTIPSLYDIEWVAWLLTNYNSIIIYLIIAMSVILLCYVLMGSLTIQRGIIGLVGFAFLAFLPPVAINTVVDATNEVSSTIYSTKFDYWALCQLQQYLIDLTSAKQYKASGDFSNYAALSIAMNQNASASDSEGGASASSYSGVRLKWMAPKKFSSTTQIRSVLDSTVETDANFLKNMLLESIANTTSGESFLDSDNALYLYRDYTDIYRYASTAYNLYTTYNVSDQLKKTQKLSIGSGSFSYLLRNNQDTGVSTGSGIPLSHYVASNVEINTGAMSITLPESIKETSSLNAMRKGFLINTIGNNLHSSSRLHYYNTSKSLASSLLLNFCDNIKQSSECLYKLRQVEEGTADVDLSDCINDSFNYGFDHFQYQWGIQQFTGLRNAYTGQLDDSDSAYDEDLEDRLYDDLSDYYYGLYTESPFYFFSFNIQDQLKNLTSYYYRYDDLAKAYGTEENALSSMLLQEDQSYFYNLEETAGDGFGEMRDYMNMHDLFYYIIPSLREGVELARLYDDMFGITADDDCSLYFTSSGTFSYDNRTYNTLKDFNSVYKDLTNEEKYKFWHSYNTHTVLMAYSAWVDTLLDCDYANTEYITVMGERFKVSDPLDPTTYYVLDETTGELIDGRYMVFSRSEMAYYGLSIEDLTTVEQKIINIQDNVYNASLDLMNYYTLSDEVLIQAFGMIQLFEFNKEFSQNSLTSSSYILYPQSYELKAFTYDAYLRMIVAESSDESLMTAGSAANSGGVALSNKSIYERVLDNTSVMFGFIMLINDFISVYLLPALKLFFVVMLFLMSVILLVSAATKMEMNIFNVVWKSLLAPLLSFSGISIMLSFLVSLFMTNGADAVVRTSLTIDMGDPTMALICMLVLNIVVLVLYWKICVKCFKDFFTYARAVFDNISANVVGAVGALGSVVRGGARFATSDARYFSRRNRYMRKIANGNSSSDDIGGHGTPEQRGRDNHPASGKRGMKAVIGGAVAGAAASSLATVKSTAGQAKTAVSNKYTKLASGVKNISAESISNRVVKNRAIRGLNAEERIAKLKDYERKTEALEVMSPSSHITLARVNGRRAIALGMRTKNAILNAGDSALTLGAEGASLAYSGGVKTGRVISKSVKGVGDSIVRAKDGVVGAVDRTTEKAVRLGQATKEVIADEFNNSSVVTGIRSQVNHQKGLTRALDSVKPTRALEIQDSFEKQDRLFKRAQRTYKIKQRYSV